jgi:transposase-like protein
MALVETQAWAVRNLLCPLCKAGKLELYANNHKGADFACRVCKEEFQLKSTSKAWGRMLK